jgi:hypothetical protein
MNNNYDVKCRITFISKKDETETREMIYRVEDWEDAIRNMLRTPMFETIDPNVSQVVSLHFTYTKIN